MTFSSVDFMQNLWHLIGEHRAGPKCPGWLQVSVLLLLPIFTALNCPASEISLLDQSLHLLPPRLPACPLHSCEDLSSAPPCCPGLSAVLLAHPSTNQADAMWWWTVCVLMWPWTPLLPPVPIADHFSGGWGRGRFTVTLSGFWIPWQEGLKLYTCVFYPQQHKAVWQLLFP